MLKYILKRLLLMIPTFLGTTFLVFVILSVVPGGPFERAVMQLKTGNGTKGEAGGGGNTAGGEGISPEVLEKLKRQYGLDKPLITRYLMWLGIAPRELKTKTIPIKTPFREKIGEIKAPNGKTHEIQRWIRIEPNKDTPNGVQVFESGSGLDFELPQTQLYTELPHHSKIATWYPCDDWTVQKNENNKVTMNIMARSGILTGDLGSSYTYGEKVTTLVGNRLHISTYFGLIGFILSYLVCIPLGLYKAVNHGSKKDVISSVIIFIGYAIPGYVLGSLMLVLFGGGRFWDVFPLGGFHSPDNVWSALSFLGKIKDQIHHTILPVLAYMVGQFATLTLLMKNSTMENLGQDYIRTAFAKGLPENTVIYKHALRNSLIPIATGLGGVIGLFLTGSFLIEKVFNIEGIGKLSQTAIISADYPVFLGMLVINVLILLVGNLISDLLYVLVDPRIKFE